MQISSKELLRSFPLAASHQEPTGSIVDCRDDQIEVPTGALEQQEIRVHAGKKGEVSKSRKSKVVD